MMKLFGTVLAGMLVALPAFAQNPQAMQDCATKAAQASGYNPQTQQPNVGGRARGAAGGAVAGGVAGQIQGNQYDNAPSNLKDANRQDKAQTGAAAGMVAGGVKQRQDR